MVKKELSIKYQVFKYYFFVDADLIKPLINLLTSTESFANSWKTSFALYPKSLAIINWFWSSATEVNETTQKWFLSCAVLLENPYAILLVIDTPARLIWFVKPYSSSLGKVFVTR